MEKAKLSGDAESSALDRNHKAFLGKLSKDSAGNGWAWFAIRTSAGRSSDRIQTVGSSLQECIGQLAELIVLANNLTFSKASEPTKYHAVVNRCFSGKSQPYALWMGGADTCWVWSLASAQPRKRIDRKSVLATTRARVGSTPRMHAGFQGILYQTFHLQVLQESRLLHLLSTPRATPMSTTRSNMRPVEQSSSSTRSSPNPRTCCILPSLSKQFGASAPWPRSSRWSGQ